MKTVQSTEVNTRARITTSVPQDARKFDENPEKYIKMIQDIGGNPEKCCD
jgi:hypothetical protein